MTVIYWPYCGTRRGGQLQPTLTAKVGGQSKVVEGTIISASGLGSTSIFDPLSVMVSDQPKGAQGHFLACKNPAIGQRLQRRAFCSRDVIYEYG